MVLGSPTSYYYSYFIPIQHYTGILILVNITYSILIKNNASNAPVRENWALLGLLDDYKLSR